MSKQNYCLKFKIRESTMNSSNVKQYKNKNNVKENGYSSLLF